MDFVHESLRQNQFWLHIMEEHALFIRLGLPCNETNLINEAKKLEDLFGKLYQRSLKLPRTREAVLNFNEEVLRALDQIIDFKSIVLARQVTCNIGGFNFPLLLDHVRREAIRFRVILIRLQNDIELPLAEEMLQEELFWSRIMGEHAHFIHHLLDPSERRVIEQTVELAKTFETLSLQGADLESMLVPSAFENWLLPENLREIPPGLGNLPKPLLIPRLRRFNDEVKESVMTIKIFKEQALALLKACQVLSVIPIPLAHHVLREAEMALEDLAMFDHRVAEKTETRTTEEKPVVRRTYRYKS